MPLASSVRDEDWRIALRQVIEQLAKRNAYHKKYPEIRDRTQPINAWEADDYNANFYDDNNQYYQQYKSRWWKILCLNSGKEAKDKQQTEGIRDLWNTQIEFFLSCVGFIVGVGNTLRFPSMIYQHGGGVFLIPYFICLFLFGLPLVYMHLCIGQYAGLSASGAFWKMMPLASGLGWALVLLAVPVSIYYNIIVAWSLYYFCYQVLNRTLLSSPTIGTIQPHIFIALAAAWIIVFFGVFKGIGSIGWAVTFTATVPYLLVMQIITIHKPLTDILKHDSLYLPYTVYPGVPAYMEWGPLWSALFFAMLILSAIDAEFAWLEMIASSIMNQFGSKQKRLENRLLALLCFCFFIAGIPFCARGGIYIFHSIENLNANWNSFSLSLMQIIIVCYVYGTSNFLEDIGEMLRVSSKDSEVVVHPMLRFWNKFKRIFGPTGSYIKWTWSLFSPLILAALLLASMFRYERVRFNEVILPWYYELIAWITMVGPLFVVPFTSDNDYMYIDPISRDPSTKTNRVFRGIDACITDDENYSKIDERIREWAERSAKSETGKTIELATIEEIELQPRRQQDSPEREYSEAGRRIKGRLRDWTLSNDTEPSLKMKEEEPATPSYVEDFRTPSIGSKSSDDLNLFGPPPVLEGFENSRADTIKYRSSKSRMARRSDQKKSRMFDDAFNFELATAVIIEKPPSMPSPQSAISDERHSTPERLATVRKRLSSESISESMSIADHQSVGSLSITPIDCSYTRSMSSISDSNHFLKPQIQQPLRLKRPKPIDNPPGSSKRSNASQ
uniref:Transporter n=1 Tax=Panagrolaimus sp. ES5 TaxID=591445 RepID=A0AC34FDG6_9BILA